MLATLLRPDGGEARIFGRDVVRESTAVRSLVGVTGQYASVDEDLTHTENLVIFSRLLGLSRRDAKRKSTETARGVRPDGGGVQTTEELLRRHAPSSGPRGQPHRSSPTVVPRRAHHRLDPRTRAQMWDTIRRLVAEGSTVLLTTQYLDEADQLADRIACDRPRQGHRRRHRGRVEGVRGNLGAATDARGPRPHRRGPRLISTVLGLEATVTPESGRITGRSRTRRSPGTCSSGCVTVRSPWTRSRLQAQPRRGLPHHHRSRDRRVRGSAA